MLKKYFAAVPLPCSIALAAILGCIGSGLLIIALFAAGLWGLLLFLLGTAAAVYGTNVILYQICRKVRRNVTEKRLIPLRAAAVAGVFLFLCGSFFWADTIWGVINDFWF